MLTTQEREQQKNTEKDKRASIAEQVIHTLGRPDGLHQVQVRPLWENFYRVNVFVGADAASLKVANSYFLKADSEGTIVESSPRITKKR